MIGLGLSLTLSSGGVWAPSGMGNLHAWFRSDIVTNAGGVVSAWPDQSGNGRHLTQGTAGNRPAYSASDSDWSGLPSVTTDGVDDFLSGSLALSGTTGFICAVARRKSHTGNGNRLLCLRNAAANDYQEVGGFLVCDEDATTHRVYRNGGLLDRTHPGTNVNYALSAGFDGGGNLVWRVAGSETSTAFAPAALDATSWRLGCGYVSSAEANFTNYSYQEVIIVNGYPTAAELTALGAYLLARYGTTR